jgi:outer membrane protein insertion porin family
MNINLRFILIFTCFAVYTTVYAQNDKVNIYDYSNKKTFEIGGVNIIGAETRDRNAIKSMTDLREGNKITIPGLDVQKVLKPLLKLKLFEDVQFFVDSIVNDQLIYITLKLIDKPTLSRYFYTGVKSSSFDDLNDIVKAVITKESIVTDDQKELAKNKIKDFYIEKGKLDVEVEIKESLDSLRKGSIILEFAIDPKDRVKVREITFDGNKDVSDKKLRKVMKKTKIIGTFLKKTKFVGKEYENDKEGILQYYSENGYKNARILKDSIWRNDEGEMMIKIFLNEGNVFRYKDISWKGNTLYSNEQLNSVLGIAAGDVYNPKLLEQRMRFSQDGRDISSQYLDDGYLSFNIDPVEVVIKNDSVEIEMRIYEGPQFTIGDVTIAGNDRTHEHVIRRTIRTRPGQKFSRSQIIRSQREIISLGYFNQESLDIQTPVNESNGTVDIKYKVEEKPADQLELSAGYGGFSGLIGTLGVTFNNFSLRNVKDRSTWSPLPQGDGQKLSVRVQSNSRFFRSYNLSFTEPWLGGKRPNSFTAGIVNSTFDYSTLGSGSFVITKLFAGLGRQLKWPDDFFSSSTTVNIENIAMDNYQAGRFFVEEDGQLFRVSSGQFNNFYISQVFARSSVSDPLFPRSGSNISLTGQFTLPYSLFRKKSAYVVSDQERGEIVARLSEEYGPADPPSEADITNEVNSTRLAKQFKWLEYHKWKFNSEFYFNLVNKLVLKAQVKIGLMGYYNEDLSVSPFERFNLGGDGLSNQNNQITGVDIISLRGYDAQNDFPVNNLGGSTIYDKFTLELRYPLSLNPTSTIFMTTFVQGGNSWSRFSDFNPFDVRRSAGVGLRVFLPMFGLLGFDYGFGFDKNLPANSSFRDYGRFNIVIGFEPE